MVSKLTMLSCTESIRVRIIKIRWPHNRIVFKMWMLSLECWGLKDNPYSEIGPIFIFILHNMYDEGSLWSQLSISRTCMLAKWIKWESVIGVNSVQDLSSWESCRSQWQFWKYQTLISKEMCKKTRILTKSWKSRKEGLVLSKHYFLNIYSYWKCTSSCGYFGG